MPLRADAIVLPADGPIGAVQLSGLASADLIMLRGPNGAGKSVLIQPLGAPGRAGEVECVADDGSRQEYRSKGVNQAVAFVRSTDLMSDFRDLESALALASLATADLHRARLLEQLARMDLLRDGAIDAAQEEPGTIRNQRDAYLAADRLCGQHPRTIAEYRRIGQELAASQGRTWAPGAMNDAQRVPNELLILPEHRTMEGLTQVQAALQAIKTIVVAPLGQPCGAAHLTVAVTELEASIADAMREARLPSPDAAAIEDRAAAVRTALDQAIRAMDDAIAASDLLRDCKDRAARYIGGRIDLGTGCDACPVCEQPVDGARLQSTLAAQLAGESTESSRWRAAGQRLRELRRVLLDKVEAYVQARQAAQREHDAARTIIARAASNLRVATGWAETVVNLADCVRTACERWLDQHATTPSESAQRDADALCALTGASIEQLNRESSRLNEGLEESQRRFRAFQSLGSLLAIRGAIDEIQWTVSVDQVDAERRRAEQRQRWKRVLLELAQESQRRADDASSTVVDDEGVQQRFKRLLERLMASQPALARMKFRGSSLTVDGNDRSKALSEGQTVLVNIAAVIAVVGKVFGSAAHRPGWIVFDEPTNGLDEASRDAVADYLGAMTMEDLPGQLVIATFDGAFADRLMACARRSGRRIRQIELSAFVPGQPVRPTDRTV